MKKIIILLVTLLFVQPAFARNIKVRAMSDFSTANPSKTWCLEIVEPFTIKNQFTVQEGAYIEGKISKVKAPARGKRNASFLFEPLALHQGGEVYPIKDNYKGKYSSLNGVTAGKVAQKGVVMVGNKMLKNTFGPAVALVEGAVRNEEGNVAKSAAVSVYKSTPLSYIDKGQDITILKGQEFIMSFWAHDDDDDGEE